MRPLVVTALGAAVVAAGLAAPSAGLSVTGPPERTAPGRHTEITVPGCGERDRAASPAFTAPVRLDDDGSGVATVRRAVRPGRYPVTAQCGARTVTGIIDVSGTRAWQGLLPPSLDGDPD
ncbi:hypothetical protein BTM25_41500 [Actinomadura rubteroloni]|uniref:Secreted protein n=1 Tax=Actinomadura rubteroloni TaxID=1926885 RepID=A0A2P4UKB2_9ACTN|nr:hypothetical protein [Actinomadura rubteroloni]POM25502.1 hypothetical protein BTM25_41500 [Actinomadura rubteroloni]